jgi:hypothetical protein
VVRGQNAQSHLTGDYLRTLNWLYKYK